MKKTEGTAQKLSDWELFKKLFPYVKEDRHWLWVVLILTPLGVLADVMQPAILKIGIDDYVGKGDLDGLPLIALIFFATVFFTWLSSSLGYHALQKASLRALARIRSAVYAHIMRQGGRFFDDRHAGSLMTRTINDVDAVYESLARGAIQLLTNFLTIIGMLVAMFMMDLSLTLVAFLFSPVIWLIVGWFRRQLRPVSLKIRETLSRLNGFFAERIFGMTVVQLYGAEEVSIERFDGMSEDYMRAYHKSNWLDAGLYAVMDGMGSLAIAAVVWFFAARFTDHGLTLGLLFAFVEYIGRIFVPIRELSGQIATLQRSFAALEKIFSLMSVDEVVKGGKGKLPEKVSGHLSFKDVRFRYRKELPEVLKGLDFEIKPGQVVAMVGATGSGKSTIGRLLTRLYDGYEGEITLDGMPLSELEVKELRRAITTVQQDPWMMEGSIFDNISLGDPEIGLEEAKEAAKFAQVHDFIMALPDAYDTEMSSRGRNFSSGQRQLISIARALAKKSPVVILDEATASVDPMTERLLDKALEVLFQKRTVMVIAHRLQTIRQADLILVLHAGEIVESGTHDELMAQKGRYFELVESGFADKIEVA